MAECGGLSDAEIDELCGKLKGYAKLSGKDYLSSQAVGKISKNVYWKDISTHLDTSVFPKVKDKQGMVINKANAMKFIELSADGLKKKKAPGGKPWDRVLLENLKDAAVGPGVTKTSATGNVKGMTDASKYTGSHKERFDESGKGKGMEGRKDLVANDGYVGNYKDKDTYDKKH